jgi:hypothetical protein
MKISEAAGHLWLESPAPSLMQVKNRLFSRRATSHASPNGAARWY